MKLNSWFASEDDAISPHLQTLVRSGANLRFRYVLVLKVSISEKQMLSWEFLLKKNVLYREFPVLRRNFAPAVGRKPRFQFHPALQNPLRFAFYTIVTIRILSIFFKTMLPILCPFCKSYAELQWIPWKLEALFSPRLSRLNHFRMFTQASQSLWTRKLFAGPTIISRQLQIWWKWFRLHLAIFLLSILASSPQRKSESYSLKMSFNTKKGHFFSENTIFLLRAIFSDLLHLWMPKMDSWQNSTSKW